MITDLFINTQTNRKQRNVSSEKTIRSIVKTISWRIIGTLDTMVISWIITSELTIAFSIGSIELITKMILYFGHERMWNAIKWGK
jgi:uncharacterized membrane protein